MTRNAGLTATVIVVTILSGCSFSTPGTTRDLGEAGYSSAFATGREVMSQYFSVASADPETGVIQARPTSVEIRREPLLGSSPSRHLATMRIVRDDGRIIAHASVAIQQESSSVHRGNPQEEENYTGVPNRTPAEETAATTLEQNELWETQDYDHTLERKILEDLYRALHPEAK